MEVFRVTRDSVCMGDDVNAPHLSALILPAKVSIKKLLDNILAEYKLPHVLSPKVGWKCFINKAYIAQIIVENDENFINETINISLENDISLNFRTVNEVHFQYISKL